ncbi:hypothetical protein DFH08DRAFT_701004 [Mycena albidolilacea]|uniref:Helitron helicase-like domain-containing protein n=1 Tax=Mycena albidolilacea TaxID=1033008 RepID=A0AAD7A0F9_9AGAR|nr:hypothetical protein DFH08DRAFT_701004 [Mycena albidolilacea]
MTDLISDHQQAFVKYLSGSKPQSTRNNPLLFGHLWPTLFPFGVGMMENQEIDSFGDSPFRKVDLEVHVAHLLDSGKDRRFQKHTSFIFVMGNLLQPRKAVFGAQLSVKRSWFPRVHELFYQIESETITTYQAKLKKNPFAKAETQGEKAVAELLKYVDYISDKIPGSIGEVKDRQQEMFSVSNCEGLPHVFMTLNTADTKNLIAQVLAGRDIDLDKLFHDMKPNAESSERAQFIALNPVAGAEFFHLSVWVLIEILLASGKTSPDIL